MVEKNKVRTINFPNWAQVVIVVLLLGLLLYFLPISLPFEKYIYVIAISVTVSITELLTRYSKPFLMFQVWAVWVYILVNIVSGCLAYFLIVHYQLLSPKEWDEASGSIVNGKADHVLEVFTAGLGSLFILRSSFGKIKLKNGESLDLGLGSIINLLLRWSEKEFDTIAAQRDMFEIKDIMKPVVFKLGEKDLPLICLGLMKSIDANDTEMLGKEIAAIDKTAKSEMVKSYMMGTKLYDVAGLDLLKKSVQIYMEIGDNIPDSLLKGLSSKLRNKIKK